VASSVDIANMALAHLGDEAAVTSFDPPDGSAQAEHCARYYPIARDVCLEAHSWKFARLTTQLTSPLVATVDGWTYAYALPTDFLKVGRIYPAGARRDIDKIYEFDTEADATGQLILLTDVENPYLVYVRVIEDTSKFTPTFVTALSYLLASMLAGPVIKGEAGETASKNWLQVWRSFLGMGTMLDGMNQRVKLDPLPGPIAARA
jgi:hypothetical protein